MEQHEDTRAEPGQRHEEQPEPPELREVASRVLPYSAIVGQDEVKRALEVTYVAPRLGGVLLSGERGTGKSTAARAFSLMIHGELPVTLPINATEDRVVGGWNVAAALQGDKEWETGLLHKAGKDGRNKILYVDEVNLLDDHLVNILLDVTATGILEVQREGYDSPPTPLDFTLVGTMNPEEGGLRPQLLDRFGVMVNVCTEDTKRATILRRVLDFDHARGQKDPESTEFLSRMAAKNAERRTLLQDVRDERLVKIEVPDSILDACVDLASKVGTDGHRGERVLALAARAHAAIEGDAEVESRHVRKVAAMALQHRQKGMAERSGAIWEEEHEEILDRVLGA